MRKAERESSVFSVEDKPSYPHGIRLELDEETVAKLGLTDVPEVGDMMNVIGRAEVITVRKEEGRGDDHSFSITLQLQELDVSAESKEKMVSNVLYSGES